MSFEFATTEAAPDPVRPRKAPRSRTLPHERPHPPTSIVAESNMHRDAASAFSEGVPRPLGAAVCGYCLSPAVVARCRPEGDPRQHSGRTGSIWRCRRKLVRRRCAQPEERVSADRAAPLSLEPDARAISVGLVGLRQAPPHDSVGPGRPLTQSLRNQGWRICGVTFSSHAQSARDTKASSRDPALRARIHS